MIEWACGSMLTRHGEFGISPCVMLNLIQYLGGDPESSSG